MSTSPARNESLLDCPNEGEGHRGELELRGYRCFFDCLGNSYGYMMIYIIYIYIDIDIDGVHQQNIGQLVKGSYQNLNCLS